jgi:hypothetical protein
LRFVSNCVLASTVHNVFEKYSCLNRTKQLNCSTFKTAVCIVISLRLEKMHMIRYFLQLSLLWILTIFLATAVTDFSPLGINSTGTVYVYYKFQNIVYYLDIFVCSFFQLCKFFNNKQIFFVMSQMLITKQKIMSRILNFVWHRKYCTAAEQKIHHGIMSLSIGRLC